MFINSKLTYLPASDPVMTTVAAFDMRSAAFLAFTQNLIVSPAFTSISAYAVPVFTELLKSSVLYWYGP